MRIACPNCRAEYEVPDATVAKARAVRCAQCGTEWSPGALAAAAAASEPEMPPPRPSLPPDPPPFAPLPEQPPPMAEQAALPAFPSWVEPPTLASLPSLPEEPAPRRRGPALAWAGSLVLLVGIGAGAYVWRGQIVRAWPPSERLYAALRLAAPPAAAPAPTQPAPAQAH